MNQEKDPMGKDPHAPGAKVDDGKVRMHLITGGMARALTEVAKIGTFGAKKYTEGGWIDVPNGFSRYEDAQQRHAAARHMGEDYDQDSGLLHLAHEAWNALAKLDLFIREQEKVQAKTKSEAEPQIPLEPEHDINPFLGESARFHKFPYVLLFYTPERSKRFKPLVFTTYAQTSAEAIKRLRQSFQQAEVVRLEVALHSEEAIETVKLNYWHGR